MTTKATQDFSDIQQNSQQGYISMSLRLGIIYAVAFPLIYESYANIMKSFAVAVAVIGCVIAGIKLSRYNTLQALSGYFFYTTVGLGFGAFAELMVHRHIVSWLEKHSRYFYMSLEDVVSFAGKMLVCVICGFAVCVLICFVRLARDKIKGGKENSSAMIDNAFSDGDDE